MVTPGRKGSIEIFDGDGYTIKTVQAFMNGCETYKDLQAFGLGSSWRTSNKKIEIKNEEYDGRVRKTKEKNINDPFEKGYSGGYKKRFEALNFIEVKKIPISHKEIYKFNEDVVYKYLATKLIIKINSKLNKRLNLKIYLNSIWCTFFAHLILGKALYLIKHNKKYSLDRALEFVIKSNDLMYYNENSEKIGKIYNRYLEVNETININERKYVRFREACSEYLDKTDEERKILNESRKYDSNLLFNEKEVI